MLNDLLPKTLAFYTKCTYTTQAHLYSNFSLISVDVDSLNFVHFHRKIFPDMYPEQQLSMKSL